MTLNYDKIIKAMTLGMLISRGCDKEALEELIKSDYQLETTTLAKAAFKALQGELPDAPEVTYHENGGVLFQYDAPRLYNELKNLKEEE